MAWPGQYKAVSSCLCCWCWEGVGRGAVTVGLDVAHTHGVAGDQDLELAGAETTQHSHHHDTTHPAVVPGSLETERIFEIGLVDGAGDGRVVVVAVGDVEQPHVSLLL